MDNESRYSCEQHLDALVTIELAARLAMLDRRPVNRAIRSCWAAIRPRIDNKLNRQISMAWLISLCRMAHCVCCDDNWILQSARRMMMTLDDDDADTISRYIRSNQQYNGPVFVDVEKLRLIHMDLAVSLANLSLWRIRVSSLLKK